MSTAVFLLAWMSILTPAVLCRRAGYNPFDEGAFVTWLYGQPLHRWFQMRALVYGGLHLLCMSFALQALGR